MVHVFSLMPAERNTLNIANARGNESEKYTIGKIKKLFIR